MTQLDVMFEGGARANSSLPEEQARPEVLLLLAPVATVYM